MTSLEQAKKIYDLCVSSALKKEILTYGDVLKFLGYGRNVRGHAIRYGLELTLIACSEMKLPNVTCIVVNQSTGNPAPGGFPRNKSLEKEVKNVLNQKSWPSINVIDWKYVWDNRKRLSAKYGTPGYWG